MRARVFACARARVCASCGVRSAEPQFLALVSHRYSLRTGAFDHRGGAPADAHGAQAQALKRWSDATGGAAERLVSGSDDFTMFLWTPATSKLPIARMTGTHPSCAWRVAR